MAILANCGRCHTCGGKLLTVLDGEEWCVTCRKYRRYQSHGFGRPETAEDAKPCATERAESVTAAT